MEKTLLIKARAKINLSLDILQKRPDNYHNLSSVMQSISLHDSLVLKKSDKPGIHIKTNCPNLPTDEGNLVYRAAQLLLGSGQGLCIELEKNIPVAAGLAGGSSDCAATLLGLNELLELNLPKEELLKLGSKLGADVPFCIFCHTGGTALAEGIGDILTPLKDHPEVWIVLVRPPVFVSTKEIFSNWRSPNQAQTPAMLKAINSGNLEAIAANLSNGLAEKNMSLISALQSQGAIGTNMTGSGPTAYAYYKTESTAIAAIDYIKQKYPDYNTYLAKPEK